MASAIGIWVLSFRVFGSWGFGLWVLRLYVMVTSAGTLSFVTSSIAFQGFSEAGAG